MRILLAQINPTVGDISGNTQKILKGITRARDEKCAIVLFPELAVTGYPPDDFLLLANFIEATEQALEIIIAATEGVAAVVGTVRRNHGKGKALCNSAAVIENGRLLGFQDKILLPTYDVFDEMRYFEPGKQTEVRELAGENVAITICEDIWQHTRRVPAMDYHFDPIEDLKKHSFDFVLNLSSSPYRTGKYQERFEVCQGVTRTLNRPLFLCNQVGGNDSLIFDGRSLAMDGQGALLQVAKGFEEDFCVVDTTQSLARKETPNEINDLYQALVLGVRDYFQKLGFKKACLGISGGIDSAVVAAIAVEALGNENILGLSMPSRFSSVEGLEDAHLLAERLKIPLKELSIEPPFECFLDQLGPYFSGCAFDTTEENIQARIRGILLMAFSNKFGYIVLSTGNKSEMAMGYSTLYGDLCGGLAVISDVTKQQVYALAEWINREKEVVPFRIIEKAPSAELRLDQKDSDSLPDYTIVDQVLSGYVEQHLSPEQIASRHNYPLPLVEDLVRRIHFNEYKRRQTPPGLRVSSRAFSVGRRFPIVQRWVF